MQTTDVIAQLPALQAAARDLRAVLLSNIVLVGEAPAPPGGEAPRAAAVAERLAEAGLRGVSIDGHGNVSATLPGRAPGGRRTLLVVHLDTATPAAGFDIEVQEDCLIGPFVGDNTVAVGALVTLPLLFEKAGVRPESDLLLLAAARTQGRGDLEGLRGFLAEAGSFQAGLSIESFALGRLNYTCIGLLRAEVVCRLPDHYDWARFGATGTIIPIGEIITRLSRIPLPRRPLTTVIMGAVQAGVTYNNVAREARLRFEVRSESAEILRDLHQQIADIVEDVGAQSGVQARLDVVARREPGGLDIAHPLVRRLRAIQSALTLETHLYPTTSGLAALRDAGIPGVTLGLTTGQRRPDLRETHRTAEVAPLVTGLAQLGAAALACEAGDAT